MMKIVKPDAWSCTLAQIERMSSGANPSEAPPAASRRSAVAPCADTHLAAHMEFVERLSPTVITVSWHDARSGCYSEQFWHLATARRRGNCSLSGELIRRGTAVYRPRLRGQRPANADWVVLAAVIDRLEGNQPDRK
jgi:hypothetical protein